jgi:hypothetical protein
VDDQPTICTTRQVGNVPSVRTEHWSADPRVDFAWPSIVDDERTTAASSGIRKASADASECKSPYVVECWLGFAVDHDEHAACSCRDVSEAFSVGAKCQATPVHSVPDCSHFTVDDYARAGATLRDISDTPASGCYPQRSDTAFVGLLGSVDHDQTTPVPACRVSERATARAERDLDYLSVGFALRALEHGKGSVCAARGIADFGSIRGKLNGGDCVVGPSYDTVDDDV